MPDIASADLPFQEAIDQFRRKIRVPVATYRDLAGDCHAKAFMVAGATNDALLADFQATIQSYMEKGKSAQDFQADFERIVKAHGWQYRGEAGWRSGVIINTNLRTSYMAGRWEKLVDEREARPFLMYQQVQRPNKRPEHAQWHGMILPIDHEFWHTHYPPNGWGCRCTAVGVSAGQMRRNGWKEAEGVVTSPGDASAVATQEATDEDSSKLPQNPANDATVAIRKQAGPANGYRIPEEWAYNVGRASRVSRRPEQADWEPIIHTRNYATYQRPEAVPLDKPRARPGAAVEGRTGIFEAVRKMLGGAAGTFTGPDGLTVGITAASLGGHLKPERAPLVPFIPEIIEDPFEIWLMPCRDKRTGRVELRRRYIKALALKRNPYAWFIAEYRKGELENVTAVASGRERQLEKQRAGILVWGRK